MRPPAAGAAREGGRGFARLEGREAVEPRRGESSSPSRATVACVGGVAARESGFWLVCDIGLCILCDGKSGLVRPTGEGGPRERGRALEAIVK